MTGWEPDGSPMGATADERLLLVIEQEALAPRGHIADWLGERGIAHRLAKASTGEALPDPTRFAGIIALGSTRSAYDDHVPWVRGELELLRRAVEADVPVLGICFGGQALARTLGAEVTRAAEPELGWLHIGSREPDLIADGPWFSWHGDVFALPDGATLLAANAHSIQAFAHGPHLGLQFHPEVTPEIIREWLSLAEQQGVIGDAEGIWRRTPDLYPLARAQALALFDRWYDRSVGCRKPAGRRCG